MRLSVRGRIAAALLASASASVLLAGVIAAPADAASVNLSDTLVAFQANTTDLYLYYPQTGEQINTGLGMKAGTSPSITVDSAGNPVVAFQANTGDLYLYYPATPDGAAVKENTDISMASGTSPAIDGLTNNDIKIAFQEADGNLWTYDQNTDNLSDITSLDTGLGRKAATSPTLYYDGNTGGALIYFPACRCRQRASPR
jgi:hypothetical protein